MEIRALSAMETRLNNECPTSITYEPKYQVDSILKNHARNLEHCNDFAEFYAKF